MSASFHFAGLLLIAILVSPSQPSPVTETVTKDTIGVALKSSATTVSSGTPVNYTITPTPVGNTAVPSGPIYLVEQNTTLAQAQLNGSTITFSLNSLSVGTHSLRAIYGGDSNYLRETSNTITEVITK